jgi:hypothetical protein
MDTPKTPREGCVWTDERCKQFDKLEQLVNVASMLNHSSPFLGRAQDCIDLAEELRKWDLDNRKPSFLSFLREQIIEDRFPKGTS